MKRLENYTDIVKEFQGSPFWKFVGFEFLHIEEGKAKIKIALREEMLNVQKMLHGGMFMSGLDTVMGLCARTTGAKSVSTIQLEVRFIQGINDGDVIFTSEIIKQTKNTAIIKGTAENLDGDLLAYSTSTFKLTF